ncbi:E3 ubiquitin-protein ligase RNF126 [Aplysia californica]|uniref:RING-type E3 ubiquitin transferase n=1 Tax=Aplysia californica TaxID=6500 RepID=A0ABM1VUF5_APLCA|nr:E3 ubiquitin-protein ligase RNF126 [Aplysia californica]
MAEATVAPPCNTRFFCHECRSEVRPNIPAYTCSRCNSGFIEEMESGPAAQPQSSASATPTDPAVQFAEMLSNAFLDPLRNSGGPGTMWGTRHRYNTRQASQAPRNPTEDTEESEDDDMRGVAPSAVFHFTPGDLHQPGQQTFHGIINYMIQRLGSDLGGGPPFVHLHGNPGDYAWGTGGLDAIISQLFSQLEGSGAPPAQKEKIESLPTVTIDQSHIDATLQCAICMDDFELYQKVRKLPCDHMYHSECIVKWLEMHGTCPVCRKDLNGEDTSTNEVDFASVFPRNGDDGQGASSSSSSSSISMGPSGSSSSSMDDHQA